MEMTWEMTSVPNNSRRKFRAIVPQTTRDAVSRIVITSGPKAGLELPLTGEPLTIGRSSESGLVIRDDYTSSHHARLLLRGDAWAIQDLESTNGTFVDGKRITSATPLRIGQPVRIGTTTFTPARP
mgnify:CR=1 FL=1